MKIVGLGDSTTAGTPGFQSPLESPPNGAGNPESQYAYWITQRHPDWMVLNRGVNGEDSSEILSRLPRDVLRERPAYVVVLAGVNDIYRAQPLRRIQSNLLAIYSGASSAGVRVVAASVLTYNSISSRQGRVLSELNTWIEAVASDSGFCFCDTNSLTADRHQPHRLASSPDGLHPDVAGYRRMGEGLVRTIESAESRGLSTARPNV
jgi:lysophospholipase L1-like esterase